MADIINISKPCTEDWNKMEDYGCGMFCNRCEKIVHDISEMNDAQVLSIIKRHSIKKFCFRINESQTNRPLQYGQNKIENKKLHYPITVMLSSYLMPSNIIDETNEKNGAHGYTQNNDWIVGYIINETQSIPVTNIEIQITGIGIGYPNKMGWFTFGVPKQLNNSKVQMNISLIDFSNEMIQYEQLISQKLQVQDDRINLLPNTISNINPITDIMYSYSQHSNIVLKNHSLFK